MSIDIKFSNSSITGNTEVLNRITGSDISVVFDKVKIDHAVKMLNDITDADVEDIVNTLLSRQQNLNINDLEYQTIQKIREDVGQPNYNVKEILKKYLPNLVTSTVANVLGKLIL